MAEEPKVYETVVSLTLSAIGMSETAVVTIPVSFTRKTTIAEVLVQIAYGMETAGYQLGEEFTPKFIDHLIEVVGADMEEFDEDF